MEPIYMTESGLQELRAELHERMNVQRVEIGRRMADARALGDLSENAEYHTSRDDARKNEGRIEEIQETLKRAKVIKSKVHSSVDLGAKVFLMKNSETEIVYTLVSPSEADIRTGKISSESPIGKLLAGKSAGEEFAHMTPGGEMHYRILSIE